MALYNYNRRYSLKVSLPPEYKYIPESQDLFSGPPLDNDYTPVFPSGDYRRVRTDRALDIRELDIDVNIKGTNKSSGSDPIRAEISVFNASPETREILERENAIVILNAGYEDNEDNLPLIFSGQVQYSTTETKGTDIVTTMYCADGYTPLDSVRVSKGYYSGTYEDVLKDLASIFSNNGIPKGRVVTNEAAQTDSGIPYLPPSAIPIPERRGYVVSGFLKSILTSTCEMFGYNWYIVNSKLYIEPRNYKKKVGVVELSTNDCFSIKTDTEKSGSVSTDKSKKGVKVSTFLNGNIQPSSYVDILDGDFKGLYKVISVSHRAQLEGVQWDTEFKAERV